MKGAVGAATALLAMRGVGAFSSASFYMMQDGDDRMMHHQEVRILPWGGSHGPISQTVLKPRSESTSLSA
jgi:phospholipid N-methyltransferase